jgi:hypothetical protein
MRKHMTMMIATLSLLAPIACQVNGEEAITASGYADIRAKVVAPSDRDIDIIVPDQSIYGITYGSSEEEFIQRFGKPDGYLQLRNRRSGMLFGESHIFIFTDGRLSGVRISNSVVDWKLARQLQTNPSFENRPWRLDNGIKDEMLLHEVKKILGERLKENDHCSGYYFREGKTTVTLDISRHYGTLSGPPSKEDSYTERLNGIFLERD